MLLEPPVMVQAVIQGFPDDFHLGTLPSLLSAVGKLQAGVKIHAVLSSLLDRLARCMPDSVQALPCWDTAACHSLCQVTVRPEPCCKKGISSEQLPGSEQEASQVCG